MKQKTYLIKFEEGLHARPMSLLIRKLRQFNIEEITVEKGGKTINGLSILEFLAIGPAQGSLLTFKVSGSEEDKVIAYLDWFFSLDDEGPLYDD